MDRHIALFILWMLFFVYSFLAHRIFLPRRKTAAPYTILSFAAVIGLIAAGSFLLPLSMFRMVSFLSTFIIVLTGILFFQGKKRQKAGITVMIYLICLIAESISGLAAYVYQIFFTSVRVTNNIVLSGEPGALLTYIIGFGVVMLFVCRGVFPWLRQCISALTPAFFFRFTGAFFLIFLLSNGMMNLLYLHSLAAFCAISVLVFVLIGIAARYAMRSFQVFMEQEKERTKLMLRRNYLEQQTAHAKELEERYREMRRQNHDIANHLFAVSYLIDSGQWEKTQEYIEKLLEKKGEPS